LNDLFVPQGKIECKQECSERRPAAVQRSFAGSEAGAGRPGAFHSNPAINLPARFNHIDGQSVLFLNQKQNPVAADAR
jgi:hypothetical protein